MKYDTETGNLLREIAREVDDSREHAGGCGGRCHAFGCSQDCCLEPYHDGPHRCHNHK